jgi:WD40 repeat protein
LQDLSDSGRLILYGDALRATYCRDVDKHKFIYSRPWDGSDVPTGAWITGDDRSVAEYFGNGKAELIDILTGKYVSLGQDVWGLEPTNRLDDLIAASTSVRVIKSIGEGSAIPLVSGSKLGRDDRGAITVFHEAPLSLTHYSEPGFRFLGETKPVPRLRMGFPYNGLWRMVADSTNKTAYFSDADGKQPTIALSPIPVNYSCGATRDSLCTLARGAHRIDAVDGDTGKVRWSYEVKDEKVSGLWVTPRGDTVLALVGDVNLLALNMRTGKLRSTLGGHNVRISNLSFTRDGGMFFTCGVDGRVILWDLRTLSMVQQFRGNAAMKISAADLSPDGSRVATCNFTGSWQLWDAKTGTQLMDIHGSALPMRSVLFTSDGTSLLTAGDDLVVRRWPAVFADRTVRIPIPANVLQGIKR